MCKKFTPIIICSLAIISCSLLLASGTADASSQNDQRAAKQSRKQVAGTTSASTQTAISLQKAPQKLKNDKPSLIKNEKTSARESESESPVNREKRDLMAAAGHKKYHLVKKKPKTKKIKMEVYEPKMKYKKIKMKVPVKVLKKKKVKGYMVKKKYH